MVIYNWYHWLSKYTFLEVSYQRNSIIIIIFYCFDQHFVIAFVLVTVIICIAAIKPLSFWCFDSTSNADIVFVTGLSHIEKTIISSQGKNFNFQLNKNPGSKFFS